MVEVKYNNSTKL